MTRNGWTMTAELPSVPRMLRWSSAPGARTRTPSDVAQDAFISAWKSLDKLENPEAFGGWLLRISRNAAPRSSTLACGTVSRRPRSSGLNIRRQRRPEAASATSTATMATTRPGEVFTIVVRGSSGQVLAQQSVTAA